MTRQKSPKHWEDFWSPSLDFWEEFGSPSLDFWDEFGSWEEFGSPSLDFCGAIFFAGLSAWHFAGFSPDQLVDQRLHARASHRRTCCPRWWMTAGWPARVGSSAARWLGWVWWCLSIFLIRTWEKAGFYRNWKEKMNKCKGGVWGIVTSFYAF